MQSSNPQFIESIVWKRATYFSCTSKAVDHLQRYIDRPLGLDDLASIACMERTTFSKAFRNKTGMTLHAFIQAYRVSQAVVHMEKADSSITEIAFSVGFGSLDTFERVFKKVVGATPSAYRFQMRLNNGLIESGRNERARIVPNNTV
jgi:AraC-like DNA-binding protein